MINQDITSHIIQLASFQKEKLYREIIDFIQFNKHVSDTSVSICPVCGVISPRIIKKGLLKGKQRYQCKECNHKFISSRGKLSYYSQQPSDAWATRHSGYIECRPDACNDSDHRPVFSHRVQYAAQVPYVA